MTAPAGPAASTAGESAPAGAGGWRAAVEAAVVVGLALFAAFRIIPQQTASGEAAAGLAPATLPTACAAAIAVLALLQLGVTWMRKRASAAAPAARRAREASAGDASAGDASAGDASDDDAFAGEEASGEGAAGSGAARAPVAVIRMMLVCLAGAIALRHAGVAACAATIVALGMIALGERRPLRILLVTLVAMLPYLVLFR